MSKIIEYDPQYEADVKDLLVELQQHLASLDRRGVLVLKENYRDGYFAFVTEECKKHDGKIYLAVDNERAVGMIVCKIFQGGGEEEFTTSCPKVGFISDLVVADGMRGQGIGKALIDRAEAYFSEKRCEYIQLEVFEPNRRAFELYQKLGFSVNCYYLSKKVKDT